MMPSGPREGWELLRPLLESIAARAPADAASSGSEPRPCVSYIGPGGSGHYVKMVHNGIEYGDMQLIAEATHFCRAAAGMSAAQLATLLSRLSLGPLDSFLMETTAAVFRKADGAEGAAADAALVDAVRDECGSKGTGKWTIQQAAELGVPCSTHAAALEARYLSSLKPQRGLAAAALVDPADDAGLPLPPTWEADLEDALLASKLCSYAQGLAHLRAASEAHGWGLRLHELGAIWRGGCIIRAKVLRLVSEAYAAEPALPNLLLSPAVASEIRVRTPGWRRFVVAATQRGLPIPALSASLAYYDSFRAPLLPSAQCIQAQRDCFGGHGFQRLDVPGTFHAQWR
jgi:6-phosphogluconate dehydrogenase